ncbi:MAG: hypothetical protein R3E68_02255 [Burkholderiaceae bacterium]
MRTSQISPLTAMWVSRGCCYLAGRYSAAQADWQRVIDLLGELGGFPAARAYAIGLLLTFRMTSGALADWQAAKADQLATLLDELAQLCRDEGLEM